MVESLGLDKRDEWGLFLLAGDGARLSCVTHLYGFFNGQQYFLVIGGR
jgi:hypothetical protein